MPNHIYIYVQLRSILHQEVFDVGFQLPRFHPLEGRYNWTPPIADDLSTVTILSILGEDDSKIDEEVS